MSNETQTLAPDSATERTWYGEFYDGIDHLDLTVVERLCTPDTTMRIGNHPTAVGADAVRDGMTYFFTLTKGMSHTFVEVFEYPGTTVIEAVVKYTRLSDTTVDIPVSTSIDRRDGLIAAQRIYKDTAPLFSTASLS